MAMTYAPQKATGTSETGKVFFPAYMMLALTLIGIAVALYVAKGNYWTDAMSSLTARIRVSSA